LVGKGSHRRDTTDVFSKPCQYYARTLLTGVVASGAKQSSVQCKPLWIASSLSLLAMTLICESFQSETHSTAAACESFSRNIVIFLHKIALANESLTLPPGFE
jgi:hypothetical protein